MGFSIGFVNKSDERPFDDLAVKAARGVLLLGDTTEGFLANLGEWDRATYQAHWRRSLRLLLDGFSKTALITTYSSPSIASHLEWWALYRTGDLVHIQNQLVLYDNLDRAFSVESANSFLKDRETEDEDGAEISEWAIPFRDVESFAKQLLSR